MFEKLDVVAKTVYLLRAGKQKTDESRFQNATGHHTGSASLHAVTTASLKYVNDDVRIDITTASILVLIHFLIFN